MGGLWQACEILANACAIGVGRGEIGKAGRHAEHMERAGKDRKANRWVPGFQPLQCLHRDEHALCHEPLRQFAPSPRERDILTQLRDGALALGRQSACGSGGTWHGCVNDISCVFCQFNMICHVLECGADLAVCLSAAQVLSDFFSDLGNLNPPQAGATPINRGQPGYWPERMGKMTGLHASYSTDEN